MAVLGGASGCASTVLTELAMLLMEARDERSLRGLGRASLTVDH